jgi:hypothetical protein
MEAVLSEIEISPLRAWFAEKCPGEPLPANDAALKRLLIQKYVAAKTALTSASDIELQLRQQITLLTEERAGTQTFEIGEFEVKVSRTQKAVYGKLPSGESSAMQLYADHEELRDVFRITFDERVSEMEKKLSVLELTNPELADEIKAVRKLQLASPQVKVEFK